MQLFTVLLFFFFLQSFLQSYSPAILKTLILYHIFKSPLADMALKFSKMTLSVRLSWSIALCSKKVGTFWCQNVAGGIPGQGGKEGN